MATLASLDFYGRRGTEPAHQRNEFQKHPSRHRQHPDAYSVNLPHLRRRANWGLGSRQNALLTLVSLAFALQFAHDRGQGK
jgi:hypothetical protein